MKLRAPGEGLSIYTVVKTLAVASAVPEIGKALIEISAAGGHQRSMGLLGSFGDDIDDTVDSICSPDGAARASNDFDPFDILKQCVLDLPIDAGEQNQGRHDACYRTMPNRSPHDLRPPFLKIVAASSVWSRSAL